MASDLEKPLCCFPPRAPRAAGGTDGGARPAARGPPERTRPQSPLSRARAGIYIFNYKGGGVKVKKKAAGRRRALSRACPALPAPKKRKKTGAPDTAPRKMIQYIGLPSYFLDFKRSNRNLFMFIALSIWKILLMQAL